MKANRFQDTKFPTWAIALSVIWLMVFSWLFFRLDLPNNTSFNRDEFWLDIPDQVFYLFVQHPDAPQSSWANFSQRMPLILTGLWIVAGAYGLGALTLRLLRVQRLSRLERLYFSLAAGYSLTSLMTLLLGLLAQRLPMAMSAPTLGTGLTIAVLLEAMLTIRHHSNSAPNAEAVVKGQTSGRASVLELVLRGQIPYSVICKTAVVVFLICFFMAMMLGSLLPSVDFDVKEYHLQGPKEYYQCGNIHFLKHNVYTSFPFLTEMLTLSGMILRDDWKTGALIGKFVLMTFAVVNSIGVFAIGKRFFNDRVAWAALLIYVSTPWTYRISIIAYAEGGLTCYLFATLLAVLIRHEHRSDNASGDKSRPMTLLCGLLAGSAMGCKYPGVLSVVLPLGIGMLVADFRHSVLPTTEKTKQLIRTGLLYSLGVLIAVGPWLLKNVVETGNPVYPLLNNLFGGIDWNETLEANWNRAHSPDHHQLSDLLVKFHDVTVKSDWLSPLLFSFFPLAFVVKTSSSTTRWLAAYVAFLFLSWWVFTHRIDRFWIPLIPVVSVVAGVGAWWTTDRTWRCAAGVFVALCVLFNLAFISTPSCGLNSWLADLNEVQKACQGTAPGIQFINNSRIPEEGAKVLSVGEAEVFDAEFPIVYNTVFDVSIFEEWTACASPAQNASDREMKPPEEILSNLRAENVKYILVNWQEILRYRETYGYSEYVTPWRFDQLTRMGVLSAPQNVGGGIEYKQLSPTLKSIVDQWPSEIRIRDGDNTYIPSNRLYKVLY